jgi:capsular polysaccharide biosynthesis protein
VEEINLYDLVRYYIKNWLNIVTAVLVGAIIGVAYTYLVQTPLYESKATLLAIGTGRTSANQDSVVLNNYVGLFKSHRVIDPVMQEQDYKDGYDKLISNTTAENQKNTDIIKVSISTKDPKTSKALLESAIQSFRLEAKELYGDNTIDIKTVDSASVPTQPSNVKPYLQIGLAVMASVALAIIILFFMYDYSITQRFKNIAGSKDRKQTKKEAADVEKSKEVSRFGRTISSLLVGASTSEDKTNKK